jgi:hypothetical protein
MSALTDGTVGVSITAGHIAATDQPRHPVIGQQVVMGTDAAFMLHITPDVARQWIDVLTPIAKDSK